MKPGIRPDSRGHSLERPAVLPLRDLEACTHVATCHRDASQITNSYCSPEGRGDLPRLCGAQACRPTAQCPLLPLQRCAAQGNCSQPARQLLGKRKLWAFKHCGGGMCKAGALWALASTPPLTSYHSSAELLPFPEQGLDLPRAHLQPLHQQLPPGAVFPVPLRDVDGDGAVLVALQQGTPPRFQGLDAIQDKTRIRLPEGQAGKLHLLPFGLTASKPVLLPVFPRGPETPLPLTACCFYPSPHSDSGPVPPWAQCEVLPFGRFGSILWSLWRVCGVGCGQLEKGTGRAVCSQCHDRGHHVLGGNRGRRTPWPSRGFAPSGLPLAQRHRPGCLFSWLPTSPQHYSLHPAMPPQALLSLTVCLVPLQAPEHDSWASNI